MEGRDAASLPPSACPLWRRKRRRMRRKRSVRRKFVAGVEEMEKGRKWCRPATQLDWLLQREWLRCPLSLCLWQAAGLNFGLTLSAVGRRKTDLSAGWCQFTWLKLRTVIKKKAQQGERSSYSQGFESYLLEKLKISLQPCLNNHHLNSPNLIYHHI